LYNAEGRTCAVASAPLPGITALDLKIRWARAACN
jgi:hypothetical protein